MTPISTRRPDAYPVATSNIHCEKPLNRFTRTMYYNTYMRSEDPDTPSRVLHAKCHAPTGHAGEA